MTILILGDSLACHHASGGQRLTVGWPARLDAEEPFDRIESDALLAS